MVLSSVVASEIDTDRGYAARSCRGWAGRQASGQLGEGTQHCAAVSPLQLLPLLQLLRQILWQLLQIRRQRLQL